MNTKCFATFCCALLTCLPNTSFCMTGKEWYEACSELLVATPEQRKNAAPEKKVKYRACQIEANRAWCDSNLEGDVTGLGELQKKQLSQACPTLWSMPFGGPFVVIVVELEKNGGPALVEKWLPASHMLKEALRRRWPACSQARWSLNLTDNPGKCFDAWNKNIE